MKRFTKLLTMAVTATLAGCLNPPGSTQPSAMDPLHADAPPASLEPSYTPGYGMPSAPIPGLPYSTLAPVDPISALQDGTPQQYLSPEIMPDTVVTSPLPPDAAATAPELAQGAAEPYTSPPLVPYSANPYDLEPPIYIPQTVSVEPSPDAYYYPYPVFIYDPPIIIGNPYPYPGNGRGRGEGRGGRGGRGDGHDGRGGRGDGHDGRSGRGDGHPGPGDAHNGRGLGSQGPILGAPIPRPTNGQLGIPAGSAAGQNPSQPATVKPAAPAPTRVTPALRPPPSTPAVIPLPANPQRNLTQNKPGSAASIKPMPPAKPGAPVNAAGIKPAAEKPAAPLRVNPALPPTQSPRMMQTPQSPAIAPKIPGIAPQSPAPMTPPKPPVIVNPAPTRSDPPRAIKPAPGVEKLPAPMAIEKSAPTQKIQTIHVDPAPMRPAPAHVDAPPVRMETPRVVHTPPPQVSIPSPPREIAAPRETPRLAKRRAPP